jgi:peptidyl-prolyl cis-trans isomerase SurA
MVLALTAGFAMMAGTSPARAQNVVVMVNGEPITNYDIDQRTRLAALSGKKSSRQEVMNELIDEKLKIKEGKKYGVDPSGGDVDSSFGQMAQRMRLNSDQLTKMLASKGIRPATLKARIKAEIVWGSLIRGRFKESLQVGEQTIRAAAGEQGESKEGSSFEYRMRPIVLIVPRGSPSSALESRKREAEALRSRVQTCDEAKQIFSSIQNATIRDPVIKTSADLPAALREILDKTPVGHLTAPEVTRQGIEMVALCDRKVSTADTPQRREIREKIYSQRYEEKSKSYLQDLRKAAMIEYRQH